MEIFNYNLEEKDKPHQHHWLLPNSIRCVICGPSGCGKTNLMLNLLLNKGYLNYDRLHLYAKSLGQDKYQVLRDWAEALAAVSGKEFASFHSSSEDIIPVENLDDKERSIMIFDDVIHEKQPPIEKYFSQGRNGGADCFYLTQDYYKIPKIIRGNCNLLVLFTLDTKTMRSIHDSFVGGDMDFAEFREYYTECWPQRFGFLVIDFTREPYNGKYRCGFDRFYIPKSFI